MITMVTKTEIRNKAHEILQMQKTIDKGLANENLKYYIFFECGKLHQMAITYAEKDKKGLSNEGMETLKDFDTFDDVKAYVVAIQCLIFNLVDFTDKTYDEMKEIIKRRKMQYITA